MSSSPRFPNLEGLRRRPPPREAAPNRPPWPPLVYVAATGVAVVLGRMVPVDTRFAHAALKAAGVGLILVGVGLEVWAMAAMARQRANILPHRAATALVTSGPFASIAPVCEPRPADPARPSAVFF